MKTQEENQRKTSESLEFSYRIIFIALVLFGFFLSGFISYQFGTHISEKEKKSTYNRGYYNGHEHAKLRYDNPKTKL